MKTTMTRRTAVASLATAPMISTAALGESAAATVDPIFAAIEAAKVAEAASCAALERAESEAPARPNLPVLRERLAAVKREAATRTTDCATTRKLLQIISETEV